MNRLQHTHTIRVGVLWALLTCLIAFQSVAQAGQVQTGDARFGDGGESSISTDDLLNDALPVEDLAPPETPLFLLPEVIVDLQDPEYEDVETLLLQTDNIDSDFSVLPDLGGVSGLGPDDSFPGNETEEAEEQESNPAGAEFSAYLGGGFAPGIIGGGELTLRLPGEGRFFVESQNLWYLGSLYSSLRTDNEGLYQRENLLTSGYRGTGTLSSFEMQVDSFALGAFEENDLSRLRLIGGEISADFRLWETRDQRLTIAADIAGSWSRRRLAAEAGSTLEEFSSDFIRSAAGLHLNAALAPWIFTAELGYSLAAMPEEPILHRPGVGLGAVYAPSDRLSVGLAWKPVFTPGSAVLYNVEAHALFTPFSPVELLFEAGHRVREISPVTIHRLYPLHSYTVGESGGLLEPAWFFRSLVTANLGSQFRLHSDVSLRYSNTLLSAEPADIENPRIIGKEGWYAGRSVGIAWFISEDFRTELAFGGSVIGEDIGDNLRLISAKLEYLRERFAVDFTVEQGLYSQLRLPEISSAARFALGRGFGLRVDLIDPLAPLLPRESGQGNPAFDSPVGRGFSIDVVTTYRN